MKFVYAMFAHVDSMYRGNHPLCDLPTDCLYFSD